VTVGRAAFRGSAAGEARKPCAGYPLGQGEVVLHAILRRKTGQSGLHEAIFERQDVGRYEDPLTSAVFERLAYLPIATSWRVLGELLRLPDVPGDPESWLLWPRLRLEDGIVEPDVVIVFADFVLVIEAKHWTGHSTGQWSREVDAVHARFQRDVKLLALGAGALRHDSGRHVVHASWQSLAVAVRAARLQARTHEARVLDDITDALHAFGYRPGRPLASLGEYRPVVPFGEPIRRWRSR
jgi:hypothetical protein